MNIPSGPFYQHGDIFGVPSNSILGKLNKAIFWPHTNLFHFGIIADYIPKENDYVILDSTKKGISVGRLSWYKEYRVFRPKDPIAAKKGIRACQMLTKHGRAKYDYALFFKLLFGCVKVWLKHLFRGQMSWEIEPSELPYARDSRFICTEAANEAWRMVGYPIVPDGIIKLPAGFILAFYKGRLVEVLSEGTIVTARFLTSTE